MLDIMREISQKSKAKGDVKFLLWTIAGYAKPDGTGAHPSVPTIMSDMDRSRSQVYDLLQQAERGRHLGIEHHQGPKGGNLYTILRPWQASTPDTCTDEPVHHMDLNICAGPPYGPELDLKILKKEKDPESSGPPYGPAQMCPVHHMHRHTSAGSTNGQLTFQSSPEVQNGTHPQRPTATREEIEKGVRALGLTVGSVAYNHSMHGHLSQGKPEGN